MDAVVAIDKPAGMTSHDVVDVIRKRFETRRVGHGGTLDPDATGVLLIGLGKATRLLSYAQRSPKRYTAVAVFGVTTTTQDASGEVVERRPALITQSDIEHALGDLRGEIFQVPPMVSAVKVDGERLYKKARRGEDVERHARKITVSRFELQRFEPGETPTATFDITGSGGTYVRTLIHDLGATLGCGAHMAVLRRTEAGGFTEADLVPLDGLEEGDLLPMAEAVRGLPRIEINEQGAKMVSHGRSLSVGDLSTEFVEEGHAAAIVHAGALLAIYRRKQHQLVADKVVS